MTVTVKVMVSPSSGVASSTILVTTICLVAHGDRLTKVIGGVVAVHLIQGNVCDRCQRSVLPAVPASTVGLNR